MKNGDELGRQLWKGICRLDVGGTSVRRILRWGGTKARAQVKQERREDHVQRLLY